MSSLRRNPALGCAAATVVAGSLLAACGDSEAPTASLVKGTVKTVPAGDPRPYARGDAAFGLAVLSAWCRKDPGKNVVFSPSSLSSGLGMVRFAARGETAAAMTRTLRQPGGDPLAGLRARNQAFRSANGPDVTLKTTDQVWSNKTWRPNAAYLDQVATAYDAGLNLVDFEKDPEGARKTINADIKKATGGHIADLLPEGSVKKDIGWVLTDAVYLKAKWESAFKRSDTQNRPFTTSSGTKITTPTMSRDGGDLRYARAGGWTAVDMPYQGRRISMTALLPEPGARGCPALDAATLDKVTGALTPSAVQISMPKVKLRSKADMKPMLADLGMGTAFSDKADLTGLSPKAGKLAFVHHAATLLVDEKGTEAAAATGSGVEVTSAPPPAGTKVVFDRPYLLLVRDTRTGEPLFLARVADPSKS
ncbi:serpin family protein [Spirillospora sp. CA-294931]|uniref:serpin family protein n=1 Tax=Spirillospora sp. CA-294931 TaxID=3240042 RepID=UPI003D8A8241